MSEPTAATANDLPLALLAPAKLNKEASAESCGLFFPYGTSLPIGLAVDWGGETHLIHLDGPYQYKEAGIDIGHSIRGVVVKEIEFRADPTSRYKSGQVSDPPGAIVVQGGELVLYCRRLGNDFHDDPHPVPVGSGYPVGAAEEACGFTRWSIAVCEDGRARVLRTFEALPVE